MTFPFLGRVIDLMKNYRPSKEVLTACGFRPSTAPNQWCHMQGVHMHYIDSDHALEIYNGLPHPFFCLNSQNDEAFRAEIQALALNLTI